MIKASCPMTPRISLHNSSKPGSGPGGSASGSGNFSSLMENFSYFGGLVLHFFGPHRRLLSLQFLSYDEEIVLVDEYLHDRRSSVEVM
jgi:hypothetical protein